MSYCELLWVPIFPIKWVGCNQELQEQSWSLRHLTWASIQLGSPSIRWPCFELGHGHGGVVEGTIRGLTHAVPGHHGYCGRGLLFSIPATFEGSAGCTSHPILRSSSEWYRSPAEKSGFQPWKNSPTYQQIRPSSFPNR
jgi:hypothetical protein